WEVGEGRSGAKVSVVYCLVRRALRACSRCGALLTGHLNEGGSYGSSQVFRSRGCFDSWGFWCDSSVGRGVHRCNAARREMDGCAIYRAWCKDRSRRRRPEVVGTVRDASKGPSEYQNKSAHPPCG